MQWADLIISKTRVVSIFSQGMKNHVLNFALLFETVLAILIIYVPTVPQYIGIYPLHPLWWLPALPFAVLIVLTDELRRFIIRRYPGSELGAFLIQETYY